MKATLVPMLLVLLLPAVQAQDAPTYTLTPHDQAFIQEALALAVADLHAQLDALAGENLTASDRLYLESLVARQLDLQRILLTERINSLEERIAATENATLRSSENTSALVQGELASRFGYGDFQGKMRDATATELTATMASYPTRAELRHALDEQAQQQRLDLAIMLGLGILAYLLLRNAKGMSLGGVLQRLRQRRPKPDGAEPVTVAEVLQRGGYFHPTKPDEDPGPDWAVYRPNPEPAPASPT